MTNQSLMKPKSVLTKRRKVIAFLLATILTVAIVTGFSSGFDSDGTIYTPDGERIVMWDALPSSGSPEDYDLISNIKYAAQRIYTAKYFKGVTDGKVVANVGLGIKYTQNVHNTRVVKDGKVFSEAISSSAAKSVAEQKYIEGTTVLYRPSTSINGGSATFADSVYKMPMEEFYRSYGSVPVELSKYIINEQTILSVTDENASARSSVNAARRNAAESADSENGEDGAAVKFEVPQSLVADENGHYRVTLELDATEASKYYRNEVRTLGGADQNPVFDSISVTIEIDERWYPVTVTSVEKYAIAIPMLGAMDCTGTLTEVFSDFDIDGEIPEYDFFMQHIDSTNTDIVQNLSPADYLANAFAGYLDGSSDLVLSADVEIGDIKLDGIKVSANLGTMNVKAKYDSLYVEYAGDKVYVTLNDIKGYIATDKAAKLADDEAIKALISGITLPDFNSLLGGDILTTLFADCEKTTEDGITRIRLPFKLADFDIDASLYIKDEDMSLVSIEGTVKAYGQNIKINTKPIKAPRFPAVDSTYADLSGVLDFVPDAVRTATGNTYGVSGTVSAMGYTVGIDAYIDRTNGIAADADISVLGQTVNVKYVNDKIYVSVGNIKFGGTADELPDLIEAVAKLADIDIQSINSLMPMIKAMLPSTVSDYLSMLNSLEVVDGNTLKAKLNLIAVPANITITRGNGRITGVNFDVKVDTAFGTKTIKLDASARLALSAPTARAITPVGEYVTFGELTDTVTALQPYADATAYSVTLGGSVAADGKTYPISGTVYIDRTDDGVAADGTLTALGQTVGVRYFGDVIYLSVGNVKVKLAAADINDILSALRETGIDVPNIGAMTDISDLSDTLDKALDAVYSLKVLSDGKLEVVFDIDGYKVKLTADPDTGAVTALGNVYGVALDISATLNIESELRGIAQPSSPADYLDAAQLTAALPTISDIIEKNGVTATLALDAGDIEYRATADISTDGAIRLAHAQGSLPIDVTYVNGTAYIAYGDILLSGTIADIKSALSMQSLMDLLPESALSVIDEITGMLDGMDIQTALQTALSAVKSVALDSGVINIAVEYNGVGVSVSAPKALSALSISASVNDLDISAAVTGITGKTVAVSTPSGSYARISDLLAAASTALPLATEEAFEIAINATLSDVAVDGAVYLKIGKTLADTSADASLTVGDLPVTMRLLNKTLYVSAGSVRVQEQLSRAAVLAIAERLDDAIDGAYDGAYDLVTKLIESIDNFSITALADSAALSSVADGFKATVDLTDSGLDVTADITATVSDGALSALAVSVEAFGIDAALDFDVTAEADASIALTATSVTFAKGDTQISLPDLAISVGGTQPKTVTPIANCAPLYSVIDVVPPVLSLASGAKGANTITIDLGAYALTSANKRTDIDGNVTLKLDPNTLALTAADAEIKLFKGTDAEESVYVTYVNKVLYLSSGNIKLKFNFNSATDKQRLYDVLEKHLPAYMSDEIAKLFKLKTGDSVLSEMLLLKNRFVEIKNADKDVDRIISLLFSELNGLSGESAVKKIADMASLSADDRGNVIVTISALGLDINVKPAVDRARDIVTSAKVYTSVSLLDGLYFDMTASGITFGGDAATTISAPADADAYLSVAEFAEIIESAYNTVSSKDKAGNITFELKTFDFDYDIFELETKKEDDGETVLLNDKGKPVYATDKLGRNKPLLDADKNKVIAKKVYVYNADSKVSAVKGKLVKDGTTGKYKVNLEAHIVIDIKTPSVNSENETVFTSKVGMPIQIDAYVVNNADYPKGMAFIDYGELDGNGKVTNGERISMDYESLMQIAVSALEIMGVNDALSSDADTDDTTDAFSEFIDQYRQDIDTTVFESMDIGLDEIRKMLKNGVIAARNIFSAKADIKSAWTEIKTAGDELPEGTKATDVLKARLPEIKTLAKRALDSVTAAKAALTKSKTTSPATPDNVINGGLYKNVVNAVTLSKNDSTLSAEIDNAIATNTTGTAAVAVTQKGVVIDSIEVDGLDVNTQRLNTFEAVFDAGTEIDDIKLPTGYNTATSTSAYSDFANIKHLLFDIMNTANMMEFEIGGGANDKITMSLHLGQLPLKDVDIEYRAKVKIIDQGVGKTPRYKTAADIELRVHGAHTNAGRLTVFLVPECTTRLFFYDNVIYLHGVDSWDGVVDFYDWKYHYSYNVNYKDTMFTVADFKAMFKGDKGIDNMFKEFIFRLVPLKENLVVNIHDEIIKAVKNSGKADPTMKTFAQIFKSYTYSGGKHEAVIGLKELALDNSLADVTLTLTGANNAADDTNIRDNYVSNLHAETTFASIATLTLDATLDNTSTPIKYYTDAEFTEPSPDNAKTKYSRAELESTGLSATTIDGKAYSIDGKPCKDNANVSSIIDTLLAVVTKDAKGNITGLTNRTGGIAWERLWAQTA
ncbi:MAG: hypothetical protein NC184_02520 [Roseburia sp.]|nr:hypothetical protein [Roseburia sp.]